MAEFRIWQIGERVRVTLGDRTVPSTVLLASPNGLSLAFKFETILGGYVGAMPVLWDAAGGTFRGLLCGAPVDVEADLSGRPAEGQEPGR